MIKTFHPKPTKTWKPKGIKTIHPLVDSAPKTDVSKHDHRVRTVAELTGIKGSLPQDERFSPGVLEAYLLDWNRIFGGKG